MLAADGVTEITLLGQNVNSYGRDLQLAARRGGDRTAQVRPLFADLLRATGAVDGIRRGPLHVAAPQGHATRDVRRDGGDAGGVPAPALPAAGRALTGSLPPCTAATRAERYLERLAVARRTVPDLAVSTDIIVGFPGETDGDFAATLEVAAEARFDDAFTFIFSPRPGTEAAGLTDRFVDPAVAGERFDRLRIVVERSALAANQAPRRSHGGGARRGPEQEGPDRPARADGAAPPRPLPTRRARCVPAPTSTVEITGAAPHHLDRPVRRARGRAGTQDAHPRPRHLTVVTAR